MATHNLSSWVQWTTKHILESIPNPFKKETNFQNSITTGCTIFDFWGKFQKPHQWTSTGRFLGEKTHTNLGGVVIGIANRSEHGHGACEKRHSLHPVFQLQFSSYDRISPMLNLTLIYRMWRRVWISERDFPWGFARDLQFLRRLAYQQRLDDSCCLLALKVSMVFLEGNFELGISWVVVC